MEDINSVINSVRCKIRKEKVFPDVEYVRLAKDSSGINFVAQSVRVYANEASRGKV
jgi:hypothetical protein